MSDLKFAFIDFEFNKSSEEKMNIICCSVYHDKKMREFWTAQNNYNELKNYLLSLKDYIFVAYAAEAEASSFYSIGLNPKDFKWIDLHLEVKMLYNHNAYLCSGKHLINGKVKRLFIGDEKPSTSLASSLYKFLSVTIDTEHKTKMRDIILSEDNKLIEEYKEFILKYCSSDVMYLPRLFKAIYDSLNKFVPFIHRKNLINEMLLRGEYSARTALMVRHGTPIDVESAQNLADNVPIILTEAIMDINSQFDIKPFRYEKRTCKFIMDTKVIRNWIKKQNFKNWKLTEKGQFSLSKDAFEEKFNFRHNFPRFNFGAQILRYLKLKETLNSFNFSKNQKTPTFFDSIGSDGRSRPFMNHYGSQSSRSQPKSSGFLFLKSAWIRSLCVPPKGYAIGAIDYASQEFLLSAVCSQDQKMIDAYKEGDVYLYYGKGIGMIPPEGTKITHKEERNLCKSTVLGLSYLMTKVGLSHKLTQDTGRYVSEDEAQDLVDKFDSLFCVFSEWRRSVIDFYNTNRYLRLADGWFMFGDNPSFRSVANFPLQGAGAIIMRKAVALAQDKGLNIIFTLHDALYIMSKKEEILKSMDILSDCMKEAFCFYFEGKAKKDASIVRLDGKIWGPELSNCEIITDNGFKINSSDVFIDERAEEEYKNFKKYFNERYIDSL